MAVATTPATPAPPPGAPPRPSKPVEVEERPRRRSLRSLVRPSTTPGWLRLWGLILGVLMVAFAVLATIAAVTTRNATETIEDNLAPSLVGVQDLFASVAEANAAATGAFLSSASGTEDRAQRNLYLDAVTRSSRQTIDVSGLLGEGPEAHDALDDIGASLTLYSGEIESARLANQSDLAGADATLRTALDRVGTDIAGSVATVTTETQQRLDASASAGRALSIAAIAVGTMALAALVWFQLKLVARTNRVLNLPLLVATGLLGTCVVLLVVRITTQEAALDNARAGGYDSIASTSQIQADVFDLQSELSLSLVGSASGDLTELITEVDNGVVQAQARADSPRERAAVEALALRWARYQRLAAQISDQAARGENDAAVSAFQGSGLSAFNGLNTGVESVLSDNRAQFTIGVSDAAQAVTRLPIYTVALPVLAGFALLIGIQRRLGEYR